MTDRTHGLTESEFAELKRKRDDALVADIRAFCEKQGWDPAHVRVHASPSRSGCYCACPDGPCQHRWDGPWRDFECEGGGGGGEVTCSHCGLGSMSHSLREDF